MAHKILIWDFCGKKGARVRRVIRSHGRGAAEFLIRNIPTISCPHCGETYLPATTLHELERIKADHGSLAVKRRIAVATSPRVPRRRAS